MMTDNPQSTLALRTTVATLVADYNFAVSEIREGFETIARAERRLCQAFAMGDKNHEVRVQPAHCHHHPDWSDPSEALEKVKRQAWEAIVERLELRRVMSVKAWEELSKTLDKGKLPEITIESVATFAQGYLDSLWDMHRDAVKECFNWLRPWRDEYKTNNREEIGPKVVLTYMVERSLGRIRLRCGIDQHVIALENVFSALDGRGLTAKSYWSELRNTIEANPGTTSGETTWFRYRMFGNGNMHIAFKRLDLLAEFNAIAGGKNLRSTKSKKGSEVVRAA